MRAIAYGGFGEKGRTAIALEAEGERLLLDCGVNIADRATWYPAIEPGDWRTIRTLLITHAHEDHIAALGWAIAQGFSGRLLMTRETRAAAEAIWEAYATPEEQALALRYPVEFIAPRGKFRCGPFEIVTGRSGHIVGGVWILVRHHGRAALYCGDVVPASTVFPMDPLPAAQLMMIDASYGDDDVPTATREAAILDHLARHPASILPVPLMGRSLEMLALLPGPLALAPGMRAGLMRQLDDAPWLHPEAITRCKERLALAQDWNPGDAWPDRPLLCHDAMGLSGPSVGILAQAERDNRRVLFTGNVPAGSPGEQLLATERADWLRFPTHPTLAENVALVQACRPRAVLAHSCPVDVLEGLAAIIPRLVTRIGPRGAVDV